MLHKIALANANQVSVKKKKYNCSIVQLILLAENDQNYTLSCSFLPLNSSLLASFTLSGEK